MCGFSPRATFPIFARAFGTPLVASDMDIAVQTLKNRAQ